MSDRANALDGFVDATALLGPGVFVLRRLGEVVFVGKASGPMLAKIAALRSADRPKFLQHIPFDEVLIRRVHPDQINALRLELIATYAPKYNLPMAIPTTAIRIERRL